MHNPSKKEKIEKALNGKKAVSKYTRRFGYKSAKSAVLESREEEYDRVVPTLQSRIKEVLDSMVSRDASVEEKNIVLELMKDYMEVILKKKPDMKKDNGESR